MMGSINVITRTNSKQLGSQISVITGVHAPQSMIDKLKRFRYLTDFNIFHKSDDFRLSITGRIDQGFADEGVSDFDKYGYEWTRNEYFADSTLWGSTLIEDYPNLSGEYRSPYLNFSLDARLLTDELEVGLQYFDFQRGTGVQFTGDRFQNQATWHEILFGAHFRYKKQINRYRSEFLARFRSSVWPQDNSLVRLSGNPVEKHI